MRSTRTLGRFPAARTLTADQVLEYHAARLLLLLHVTGTKGSIRGLTKLAKLDFFVRYPDFFREAAEAEGHGEYSNEPTGVPVGSAMVRHHYGPWDPRYYDVLAYLESRELVSVERAGRTFTFVLTAEGVEAAALLEGLEAYADVASHMMDVKKVFAAKTGNALKTMIYAVFDDEVAQLARGEVIR